MTFGGLFVCLMGIAGNSYALTQVFVILAAAGIEVHHRPFGRCHCLSDISCTINACHKSIRTYKVLLLPLDNDWTCKNLLITHHCSGICLSIKL